MNGKGPRPLNSNSIVCSMSISPIPNFFSKVFCRVKTGRGGELLLKNGTRNG